ncbi:MAG: PmoA family protein [Ferruginibacter sp.]|nr:PmoA family protein [Ferruginibacter sp.]
MRYPLKCVAIGLVAATGLYNSFAQKMEPVKVIKAGGENKVDIFIGEKLFTSFLYPDTLEKPVLYPVHAANGTIVTRGFPLTDEPGDPTDHPHHIGIWFNFENLNGLDFWNNSYAIPKDKKQLYGWIKTDRILESSGGAKGILSYHANWTNQKNDILLEETTLFEFSGTAHQRIIDRVTVLTANTDLVFTDAKDGLLGIRLAHALQMPTDKDQKFTDDKGNVTIVKGGTDAIAKGNYISSEGKQGDNVWSSRAKWCKVYGKMGNDSISVAVIDHPANPNYPTFWHARGYGLFAANPLGEKIFTNDKTFKNLQLKKGTAVSFRYRIIIDEGSNTIAAEQLNESAEEFARTK